MSVLIIWEEELRAWLHALWIIFLHAAASFMLNCLFCLKVGSKLWEGFYV